ncbi:recombination protein O N-terminal domain-containing protein [Candidatus Falkowbacteria bacterium]|nr:recombination protein O N-terminal domain-containing protein [Candidatus Falkowbacteria bacterium]
MFATIKTKGIVLNQYEAKNGADALFLVYTREHGKIVVAGRGIKKLNSKLAGHLVTFGIVEFNIAGAKDIKQLIGAVLLQPFVIDGAEWMVAQDFIRGFVAQVVVGEERDIAFWDLLEQFLLKVSLNKKFEQARLFCYIWAIRVLIHFGYMSHKSFEIGIGSALNKKIVQALQSPQSELVVSLDELDSFGAALKNNIEKLFEKEMKVWI